MSFKNFKQEFWSAHIQTELAKVTLLTDFCDFAFESESKNADRVRILGVARPTISDYTGTLNFEDLEDNSQWLLLDKHKSFAYKIDDIDKAQSMPGVMETLQREHTVAMAEQEDKDVAAAVSGLTKITKSTAISTAAGAKGAIDEAFVALWDNGVTLNAECQIALTPWFYNLFKEYVVEKNTNNSQVIRTGVVGYYNGAEVKFTNNIYNDGTYDNMCVRTKKAIAFARQMQEVEAVRPYNSFSDALKGLDVYGVKVVRPKEGICLRVKKS